MKITEEEGPKYLKKNKRKDKCQQNKWKEHVYEIIYLRVHDKIYGSVDKCKFCGKSNWSTFRGWGFLNK